MGSRNLIFVEPKSLPMNQVWDVRRSVLKSTVSIKVHQHCLCFIDNEFISKRLCIKMKVSE